MPPMSHVTHMNESCHTYEWVMSHKWLSHAYHRMTCRYKWCIVSLDTQIQATWVMSTTYMIRRYKYKGYTTNCTRLVSAYHICCRDLYLRMIYVACICVSSDTIHHLYELYLRIIRTVSLVLLVSLTSAGVAMVRHTTWHHSNDATNESCHTHMCCILYHHGVASFREMSYMLYMLNMLHVCNIYMLHSSEWCNTMVR